MTKSLAKYNFPGEFKKLEKQVKVIGRESRSLFKVLQVNTTGKTNKEIDNEVSPAAGEIPSEELEGIMISDPTNKLILVRQGNIWRKVEVK